MHESARRVLTGVVFFLLTVLMAILGYVWFGWTPLEAIYMVVITIFGVGYGEVKPLDTPFQKIFTILVIIAGTTSAVYSVGGFVQMVTEGEINRAFSNQRKQLTISNLQGHVIICGFDRMGQVLSGQLNEAGQAFVVVENSPERIEVADACGYLYYQGDATHEITLKEVGIHRAKALVAVLPDDKTNVFITLTARDLSPKIKILARGELPPTERKLRLAGADHIVLPDTISAIQISNLIVRPTGMDLLNNTYERSYLNEFLANVEVQMEELQIKSTSPFVGKTLMELQVRGKGAFMVLALRRFNDRLIFRPSATQLLNVDDSLIILGHQDKLPQFAEHYHLKRYHFDHQGFSAA
ncbi:MAG: potassium channel protein [Phormidesmis sp. RL_2_1]|nr:potassium channel protein [Phormidesmis sp. RL_2_1]